MSRLPENLNDWPTDPFELLGIEQAATARDARRAYTRLIRKYKPDQFPAEFQRIHEAHESVKQLQQYQQRFERPESLGSDAERNVSDELATSDAFNFPYGDDRPAHDEAEDRFWELAKRGKLEDSLNVASRIERRSEKSHARLATYFLSRQRPDRHDESRVCQRVVLLLGAMESPEYASAAFNLLEQELAVYRRAADLPEIREYVTTFKDVVVNRLVLLARWNALGPENAKTIARDFQSVRNYSYEFGEAWPRVVYDCMLYTAWDHGNECLEHNQWCWAAIGDGDLSHGFSMSDDLERLIVAAKHRDSLTGNSVASFWLKPIPRAVTGWPNISPSIWLPYARRICGDIALALKELEKVDRVSPIGLSFVCNGLENLANWSLEIRGDSNWHDASFDEDWLFRLMRKDFNVVRLMLIKYCCQNRVSPQSVANSFARSGKEISIKGFKPSDLIAGDVVFQCIYNASIACL